MMASDTVADVDIFLSSQDEYDKSKEKGPTDDRYPGARNSLSRSGYDPSFSPNFSSETSNPHPPIALAALLLYIIFSTMSSRLLPNAIFTRPEALLILPLAHFVLLGILASMHGKIRSHVSPFGTPSRLLLAPMRGSSNGSDPDGSRRIRVTYLLGLTSAFSLLLNILSARLLDSRILFSLEVLIIPIMLVLLSSSRVSAALLPYSSRSHAPNPTIVSIATSTTFLVAFSLLGTHADGLGLAFSVIRIPLEALRIVLLREALHRGSQMGEILLGAVTVAVLSSLLGGFACNFLELDLFTSEGLSQSSKDLVLYTISFLLSQLSLFASLAYLSFAVYPALALIPRNFFLLLAGTFGRHGIPIRGAWSQMSTVLAGSTLAVLFLDPDTSASFSNLVSGNSSASASRARGDYLHLPSSSIDLESIDSSVSTPKQSSTSSRPSPTSPTAPSPSRSVISKRLALLPLLPLIYYLLSHPSSQLSYEAACRVLPMTVRSTLCGAQDVSLPVSRTVDIVVSYHKEDLNRTLEHLTALKETPFIAERDYKILIYDKGENDERELRQRLNLRKKDEVIRLPNIGREGGTYLQHILRHYNTTVSLLASYADEGSFAPPHISPTLAHRVIADHTFFLQPHLAWDWIARPRINLVDADTGFAHFGPMMRSDCGLDLRGRGNYPYFRQFYDIFRGEVCPPTNQLSAWSAQFVVSRRRILKNPYRAYAHVSGLLEAPEGHWIHDMWGANGSGGPSNPAIGHHLERAWPVVFGCVDPEIADKCPDDFHGKEECQCADS